MSDACRFQAVIDERREPSRKAFLEVYGRRFGPPPDWLKEKIELGEPRMFALLAATVEVVPSAGEFNRLFELVLAVFSETMEIARRRLLLGLLERRFGVLLEPHDLEIEAAYSGQIHRWLEHLLDAERLSDVFDHVYFDHPAKTLDTKRRSDAAVRIVRLQLDKLGCVLERDADEKLAQATTAVLEQIAVDILGHSEPDALRCVVLRHLRRAEQ